MRVDIGTSREFDDPDYYRFKRTSGLPRGYFGRRTDWLSIVTWAAIAVVAIVLAALYFTLTGNT